MKITKISVSYGRTINLGNFESARLDAMIEAELGPLEYPADVAPLLWEMAKEQVRAEYKKAKDKTACQ